MSLAHYQWQILHLKFIMIFNMVFFIFILQTMLVPPSTSCATEPLLHPLSAAGENVYITCFSPNESPGFEHLFPIVLKNIYEKFVACMVWTLQDVQE